MKKFWGSPPIVLVSVRVVSRVRDAETIRHQVLKLTPRLTGSLSAAAVSVNTRINRTFERSRHFSISTAINKENFGLTGNKSDNTRHA